MPQIDSFIYIFKNCYKNQNYAQPLWFISVD